MTEDEAVGAELQARKSYADRAHAERLLVMQAQKDYGAGVIRGLFLVNGGGAVALFTLLGSDYARQGSSSPVATAILLKGARFGVICFGVGLLLSILASALAYFNFSAVMANHAQPAEHLTFERTGKPHTQSRIAAVVVTATLILAPLTCLFSGLCFARGGFFVAHAMRDLATWHLMSSKP